ncbi:2232_t:CDS:2, partial [Dentiscutata heterogama]
GTWKKVLKEATNIQLNPRTNSFNISNELTDLDNVNEQQINIMDQTKPRAKAVSRAEARSRASATSKASAVSRASSVPRASVAPCTEARKRA